MLQESVSSFEMTLRIACQILSLEMVHIYVHCNQLQCHTFSYSIFLLWLLYMLVSRCVNLVQYIISTIKYVIIGWILDNWIILNHRLPMLCIILCVISLFLFCARIMIRFPP